MPRITRSQLTRLQHLDEHACRQAGEHILRIKVRKPVWLSSNSRGGWKAVAPTIKSLRRLGLDARTDWRNRHPAEYRSIRDADIIDVACVTHWLTDRENGHDSGNAAATAKPIIDGLTDAGYWADDSSRYMLGPKYLSAPSRHNGDYELELHVTPYTITD